MRRSAFVLVSCIGLLGVAAPSFAAGLIVFGTKDEGGGIDAFEKVIDFDTGFERIIEMQGVSASERGFDREYWSSGNGTMAIADLAPEVADRNAERWLLQNIARLKPQSGKLVMALQRPGTSPVNVTFDPASRRAAAAVIDSDFGPVRFTFSQWRGSGAQLYPYLVERLSDVGERTVYQTHSVRDLASVDAALLRRPAVAPAHQPLTGAAVVPFRTNGRSTHMLVDAVVDGKAGQFVFDTGAANIFTIPAAKARNITAKGGINIAGVGEGSVGAGFTQVASVKLGDAELRDQSFVIIPPIFPDVDGKPSPTEGLLGYEYFAHYVTTIDYKASTLTFRNAVPSDQRGIRLPFTSNGHGIFVQASVNGRSGWFGVDTGDGGGVTIFPAFAAANGLKHDPATVRAAGGGVGGAVQEARGMVSRFELGGLAGENFPVRFALNKKGAFASRYLAGNLGGRILSCYRTTLDHDRHLLWLEPQPDTPTCQLAASAKPAGD